MPLQSDKQLCPIPVGSMTRAMRAQRILSAASVSSRVVKADSAAVGRGCAYAVAVPCSREIVARELLRRSGLLGGEGGGTK